MKIVGVIFDIVIFCIFFKYLMFIVEGIGLNLEFSKYIIFVMEEFFLGIGEVM